MYVEFPIMLLEAAATKCGSGVLILLNLIRDLCRNFKVTKNDGKS